MNNTADQSAVLRELNTNLNYPFRDMTVQSSSD